MSHGHLLLHRASMLTLPTPYTEDTSAALRVLTRTREKAALSALTAVNEFGSRSVSLKDCGSHPDNLHDMAPPDQR